MRGKIIVATILLLVILASGCIRAKGSEGTADENSGTIITPEKESSQDLNASSGGATEKILLKGFPKPLFH